MNDDRQPDGDALPRPAAVACEPGSGDELTRLAPSCPAPPSALVRALPPEPEGRLPRGTVIDDFEILAVLGEGAFGVVYLARQMSLDRQVALKVTAFHGDEGRHMAQLEHENIVQVFSQTVDRGGSRRLLCMQLVPGPTLEAVLRALPRGADGPPGGAAFLAVIDRLTPYPAVFDAAGLRHRETLERADGIETVCWVGARLAEALAYAHQHGVLHRDVKPANVLVSQYARPMLADFNLAAGAVECDAGSSAVCGGTLAYMAPEHLDAFSAGAPSPWEAVGPAADVYSLGVVLYEMLTGALPFGPTPREGGLPQVLRELRARRRADPPPLPPGYPPLLGRTITRCLHPEPRRRYASAAALAAALEGCRQFRAAERLLPAGRLYQRAARHPFRWVVLAAVLPNLLGSIVNISYNDLRIVRHLTAPQQSTFLQLVLVYNLIAYPVALWLGAQVLLPVYRVWSKARAGPDVAAALTDAARATALTWPSWAARLALFGWLPGAVLFPLGLEVFAGPVAWPVAGHLAASFVVSGLIAVTYSALFVQCLTLCVCYPRLWADGGGFPQIAAGELQPVAPRLRRLQVLAGAIPLSGAVILVCAGPQEFTAGEYASFRFLVAALIGLGMLGFQLSLVISRLLSRALAGLTGAVQQ